MYVCVMAALFCWSLSLLLAGPVRYSIIEELSDFTQNWLAVLIFLGSACNLAGALLGTRFVKPDADLRTCFALGILGSPFIAAAVEVYFIATVIGAINPLLSAMSGALSFFIPIGTVWNGWYFYAARRHVEAGIPRLAQEESDDSPDDS